MTDRKQTQVEFNIDDGFIIDSGDDVVLNDFTIRTEDQIPDVAEFHDMLLLGIVDDVERTGNDSTLQYIR